MRIFLNRNVCSPIWSVLVFVGCLAGCAPSEPIRIGFVGGTSGRVADLGIAGRDAVLLAVELRNQAGGIGGRKVELLIRDDRQEPEAAQKALRDLIAEGVVAIVGPMTSTMAMAMVAMANEARIPLLSPTASTDELSGLDDHFFRLNASTRENASRIAQYHLRQRATGRLAVAYDLRNEAYAKAWLNSFSATYVQGGGELVTNPIGFAAGGEAALLPVAQALLATAADGVLIVANSMDTAMLCQQLRKLDPRIPIVTSEWAATERLLELGGKAVEGVIVAQNFDRNSSEPRYRQFHHSYRERFHREPGFGGVIAFDAANVLLDALAYRQEGRSVKETILAIRRFDGVQEPLVFNEFGEVTRGLFITVVRGGGFVVVE
ncbi:MAG: Leucine-, isoleucine-, valine-, threonine-, and alanine-binding protein precursor [Candidatus Accumulibacter adjunctus]|uniref:Leucine-, isoleucine-, valine-, threonine-, and alanine-binding protein n=1 Tax=Candidatus Accumulibacter adjunctus TaxID=1454001 RepID=A0A011PPW5_9PROT|nr:MAG: Leucine-, isoleucine-, valine-, threonine-, and alanine-binding protein precursor [Candidatus Accumulibacter adjunctus]